MKELKCITLGAIYIHRNACSCSIGMRKDQKLCCNLYLHGQTHSAEKSTVKYTEVWQRFSSESSSTGIAGIA